MPKFRGGSDDWLDNEDAKRPERGAKGGKKILRDRPEALAEADANGIVAAVFMNQCQVRMTADQSELLCVYRRSHVVGPSQADPSLRERSPVTVGDRVKVELVSPGNGIVDGVCARRNYLMRPAPGRESGKVIHVIAANVDRLAVVVSVRNPAFSPGLVDRYLVAAGRASIPATICVSKIDLDAGDRELAPWRLYRDLGYPVLEFSSRTGMGIAELRREILGQTVVFSGQSGVGKTSLLRSLLGTDIGRVSDVNEATGKGRHTTTGSIMLKGPDDTRWIDTPGVREFGLLGLEPGDLAQHFREFSALGCAIQGCHHMMEPGCAAKSLPRYSSYRRIYESLLAGEN